MAEIKWIKIATDIFDNRKIKQIESMPEADTLIVIWFKILCLAGNLNENGILIITKDIPYTDEMLATEFKKPLNTVRLALATFTKFGMIEINDDVFSVTNWQKYQNVEGMEKIREKNRLRQKRWYDKQKALPNVRPNVSITQPNETEIRDKKEDIDIEIDTDKEIERIDYQKIITMYNDTCVSFPRLRSLSDNRKKAIKARINTGYTYDDFQNVFSLAEDSTFLKGGNDRNWSATFDWMIKDASMVKILEGNYNDKPVARDAEKTSNPFLQMLREEGEI